MADKNMADSKLDAQVVPSAATAANPKENESISGTELVLDMGVSKNRGVSPKSSILMGFSIINHPFWGTPYFWKHPHGCQFSSTIPHFDKQSLLQ